MIASMTGFASRTRESAQGQLCVELKTVNARSTPVVFVLWGGYAQKKRPLIDESRHAVIASAHPSPLSANAGFFGSKPFSKINALLTDKGLSPIDWTLPDKVA